MKDYYDFSNAKRGAVMDSTGKTRITIWLDNDVLELFRARAAEEGRGYQTLINETLKQAASDAPVTLDSIRRVLREELHAA
ncbi:MAG: BrnA antitoxin family protein [Betaproteobacteria bacterium]|nr:BrnA antitoxin family protein [Betaproteobacteria bacterium]